MAKTRKADSGSFRCEVCGKTTVRQAMRNGTCSASCDLARAIPSKPDGPLPASWWLVVVCVFYFAFFNQLLSLSMALVKSSQGWAQEATFFAMLSIGIGVFWALVLAGLLAKLGSWHRSDGLVLSAAGLLLILPWTGIWSLADGVAGALRFGAANAVCAWWMARNLSFVRA